MMRFYGMTDYEVLAMPFPRLLLLYKQIDLLEIEEEMRQLVVVHTGDPKERLEVLQRHLHGRQDPGKTTEQLMESPEARLVASYTSEDIHAEHERRRRADERIRAEWEARNGIQSPGVLPPPPSKV